MSFSFCAAALAQERVRVKVSVRMSREREYAQPPTVLLSQANIATAQPDVDATIC